MSRTEVHAGTVTVGEARTLVKRALQEGPGSVWADKLWETYTSTESEAVRRIAWAGLQRCDAVGVVHLDRAQYLPLTEV